MPSALSQLSPTASPTTVSDVSVLCAGGGAECGGAVCGGVQREVCEGARAASEKDRDVLEKGTRAFMSCVRAYKEHQCNFIFRMAKLVRGNVSSHCFVRSAVPLSGAYSALDPPCVPATTPDCARALSQLSSLMIPSARVHCLERRAMLFHLCLSCDRPPFACQSHAYKGEAARSGGEIFVLGRLFPFLRDRRANPTAGCSGVAQGSSTGTVSGGDRMESSAERGRWAAFAGSGEASDVVRVAVHAEDEGDQTQQGAHRVQTVQDPRGRRQIQGQVRSAQRALYLKRQNWSFWSCGTDLLLSGVGAMAHTWESRREGAV